MGNIVIFPLKCDFLASVAVLLQDMLSSLVLFFWGEAGAAKLASLVLGSILSSLPGSGIELSNMYRGLKLL